MLSIRFIVVNYQVAPYYQHNLNNYIYSGIIYEKDIRVKYYPFWMVHVYHSPKEYVMQRTPRLAPVIENDFLDGDERQRRRQDAARRRKTLVEELHFIWIKGLGWVRIRRWRYHRHTQTFICLSPFLRM